MRAFGCGGRKTPAPEAERAAAARDPQKASRRGGACMGRSQTPPKSPGGKATRVKVIDRIEVRYHRIRTRPTTRRGRVGVRLHGMKPNS